MADFNSFTYPYERVQGNFNTLKGAEEIPYKILTYLMNLPDSNGYVPQDNNENPRVRLMKYLYYDGANPLSEPLPSARNITSLLFDGNNPVLNTDELKAKHPKGYRIYPINYWMQSEIEAKTLLKCYMGRVNPTVQPFKTTLTLVFEIVVNYSLDTVTKTSVYSKSFAMEQCIIEALHGVNIGGVGVVDFNRRSSTEAGTRAYHNEGQHLSRVLVMSVDWMDSKNETENSY
jgi:hypothetical protein